MDFFMVRSFREEKLARLYKKHVSVSNERKNLPPGEGDAVSFPLKFEPASDNLTSSRRRG